MAISITDASGKNLKVAGRGISGKSAYDYAVDGGYTGTEEEFKKLMGSGPWVPETDYVPASNPNLLDNWYFSDPVNQRKVSSGTAEWNEYWIDRWQGLCTYAINTNYITISANGYIVQYFEKPITFPVTVSILTTSGLFSAVFFNSGAIELNGYGWVDIQNTEISYVSYHNIENVNIIAVKLEPGTKQTLSNQDTDGNWVLNDLPPNMTLELIKCMRYQQVIETLNFGMMAGSAYNGVAQMVYYFPVPMRIIPTFSSTGSFKLNLNLETAAASQINVTSMTMIGSSVQSGVIRAFGPSLVSGNIYGLGIDASNPGKIILDSNLYSSLIQKVSLKY